MGGRRPRRRDPDRTALERLTLKQRLFLEAYMGEAWGSGALAAQLAGYKGNYDVMVTISGKNLANPLVRAAMEEMLKDNPLVATKTERQEELTGIMRDKDQPTKERIRSIELLGKMQGDFIERKEVVANVAVEHDVEHRHELDLTQLSYEQLEQLEKIMDLIGARGGEPLQLGTGV